MTTIHRLLRWVRLEDSSGKLSLTTIAFLVGMYLLVRGKQLSLTELGAFVTAIAAHRQRQTSEAPPIAPAVVP